jgi:hypothetical protein
LRRVRRYQIFIDVQIALRNEHNIRGVGEAEVYAIPIAHHVTALKLSVQRERDLQQAPERGNQKFVHGHNGSPIA